MSNVINFPTATKSEAKYLPTAGVAKLIRTALKDAFKAQYPAVKFSVKSSVYSGGSSIRVEWTNGPTERDVEAITNKYQGADFDGMQDLKSYRGAIEVNGEMVKMGVDFIICNRSYTADFLTRRAESVAHKYGCAMPEIRATKWGVEIHDEGIRVAGPYSVRELVYQAAKRMRAAN